MPVVDRQDIPAEARAAIRVTIGEKVYFLPVAQIMAGYSEENAPDFLTGRHVSGKSAALRSLLKGGLTLAWPLVIDYVKTLNKGLVALRLPALPLPDLKTRHKDGLLYFTQYAMALSLTLLCSLDWEAKDEPLGSDDRYVRLAGLSSPHLDALQHEPHDAVGAEAADAPARPVDSEQ
jgi:hypothetical protein